MKTEPTKLFYCASCQVENDHTVSVDGNGEFMVTCGNCGHFIKLAASTKAKDFEKIAKVHKSENEGQVSLAAQTKVLEELNQ